MYFPFLTVRNWLPLSLLYIYLFYSPARSHSPRAATLTFHALTSPLGRSPTGMPSSSRLGLRTAVGPPLYGHSLSPRLILPVLCRHIHNPIQPSALRSGPPRPPHLAETSTLLCPIHFELNSSEREGKEERKRQEGGWAFSLTDCIICIFVTAEFFAGWSSSSPLAQACPKVLLWQTTEKCPRARTKLSGWRPAGSEPKARSYFSLGIYLLIWNNRSNNGT